MYAVTYVDCSKNTLNFIFNNSRFNFSFLDEILITKNLGCNIAKT